VRRNSLAERKLSHKAKKQIRYITARRETISQLPTGTNFIPLLLSCEKWQLGEEQNNFRVNICQLAEIAPPLFRVPRKHIRERLCWPGFRLMDYYGVAGLRCPAFAFSARL